MKKYRVVLPMWSIWRTHKDEDGTMREQYVLCSAINEKEAIEKAKPVFRRQEISTGSKKAKDRISYRIAHV